MSERLDWSELLFSSAGRLSRAPFLVSAAGLIGAAWIYGVAVSPEVRRITGWVVYPVLLFCGGSITAKRFHDRGRSGWWAALVLLAIAADWIWPQSYIYILFSLVLMCAAIELCVMPGERGANRFGPKSRSAAHA